MSVTSVIDAVGQSVSVGDRVAFPTPYWSGHFSTGRVERFTAKMAVVAWDFQEDEKPVWKETVNKPFDKIIKISAQ